jgi:2,3-bisphosphoglycerate-dependent phosphoglycerate mutase
MKKNILMLSLLLAIGLLNAQNTDVVDYKKPLPSISKKGIVKTTDGKTLQIEGFNDPETAIFFLVRHAEKDTAGGSNADLNNIGRGRAAILPKILKKINIAGVYSTDKPRTRNTAATVAKAKKHTVEIYDAKTQATFVKDLLDKGKGKRYFIVGHSNTIPQLALQILRGDKKPTADLPDSEYSCLYIVSVKKIGEAKVEVINF